MIERKNIAKNLKEAVGVVLPLGLIAIAFSNVSFPHSDKGFVIVDAKGAFRTGDSRERRVAMKLLELGLHPSHELKQIVLDSQSESVNSSGQLVKKNGREKLITTPDFYIRIGGLDCFIEVGQTKPGRHKNQQKQVAEKAVGFKRGKKVLYAQLYNGDIDELENTVTNKDELLDFLVTREHVVFSA